MTSDFVLARYAALATGTPVDDRYVQLDVARDLFLADALSEVGDSVLVGIADAHINGLGHLIITKTDGTTIDAGIARPNASAGSGIEIQQLVPLATWVFAHDLGRLPSVAVYDENGEEVEPDVFASSTSVSVMWPSPRTGAVVLT